MSLNPVRLTRTIYCEAMLVTAATVADVRKWVHSKPPWHTYAKAPASALPSFGYAPDGSNYDSVGYGQWLVWDGNKFSTRNNLEGFEVVIRNEE